MTGENQPKLSVELSDLVAKSAEYLEEQKAEEERRAAYLDKQEQQHGIDKAKDTIPYFVKSMKNTAINGGRKFDINIQRHASEATFDIETHAYADTLIEYFTNQGLDVEMTRETQEPYRGSYYSFDQPRYSANLILTW